jgi:hypothetical protein
MKTAKELKAEYKLLLKRLDRANNEAAASKVVALMTIIETEIQLRNESLPVNRRIYLKKYIWPENEVMLAYAIYRMHGHSSNYSKQISTSHGESCGMGAHSMGMKVSAFWSFLEGDGSWSLCEAGKEIALKYKDKTPLEVEALSGYIVQF